MPVIDRMITAKHDLSPHRKTKLTTAKSGWIFLLSSRADFHLVSFLVFFLYVMQQTISCNFHVNPETSNVFLPIPVACQWHTGQHGRAGEDAKAFLGLLSRSHTLPPSSSPSSTSKSSFFPHPFLVLLFFIFASKLLSLGSGKMSRTKPVGVRGIIWSRETESLWSSQLDI